MEDKPPKFWSQVSTTYILSWHTASVELPHIYSILYMCSTQPLICFDVLLLIVHVL